MKRITLVGLVLVCCNILMGQETFVLNSGAIYKGKLIEVNDSVVVFKTKINDMFQTLTIPRHSVKEIKRKEDKFDSIRQVIVILKDNRRIKGTLVRENDNEIELSDTKFTKENLIINKSKIAAIKKVPPRTAFFEVGFLKGGALIGGEFDFALSDKSSIFFGAGFKGWNAGFNFYFSENYQGAGVKLVYLQQGFGDTFAGSLAGASIFYKMTPGLSLDLGLARVLSRGNYNYGGYDVILNYSAGIRF